MQGVVLAHGSLQFRELVDHFRGEIGLGDARSLFGLIGDGADHWGDFAREGGDAGDAVGLAAEFIMEGDVGQRGGHAGQAVAFHRAQVVLPEKLSVGQAGGEDFLITCEDRGAFIRRLYIGDGDEFFDAVGFRVLDGKEFLMLAHRGLQNLWRQVEEGLVDIAEQDDGPFDEARDLCQ